MERIPGNIVYKGTAIGKAKIIRKTENSVSEYSVENPQAEFCRVMDAIAYLKKRLSGVHKKAVKDVGKENAAIFELHQMILDDDDYLRKLKDLILNQNKNAEYAVKSVGMKITDRFMTLEDEYFQARAEDIMDITEQLLKYLNHEENEEDNRNCMKPAVYLAVDMSPSQIMQIKKSSLLAFATINGSTISHTAILARTKNIPALVGVNMKLDEISDGTLVIVDGVNGELIINPTKEQQESALNIIKNEKYEIMELDSIKGKESVTKSGKKVKLSANIGSLTDLDLVFENDAEGIGLFRSEFLYLDHKTFPTEEEQYQAYSEVLKRMKQKEVVIRTIDFGSDKMSDYFQFEKEDNPAMGCRAIRFCFKRPDIFKVQLKALLRASIHGNLSIMYPMIISTEEVLKIKQIVQEAANELKRDGITYSIPKQGIMIETPAAVMVSDELAGMVDFFSIGTNDLIQYTLAVDRQNTNMTDFFDSLHPAVLSMIEMTVKNAHKHGIKIGICGELGANLTLTERFLNMNIDELSVAPAIILKLRKKIREMN